MRLFEHLFHDDAPPPLDELIHWNGEFSVGNPLLDDQHREVAAVLNTLYHHHRHGGRAPDCRRLLDHVLDLLRVHTENEEEVMARHHYPDLGEHQIAHRAMLAEGADLGRALADMPQAAAEHALAALLRRIILDHILVLDMAARDYLRE